MLAFFQMALDSFWSFIGVMLIFFGGAIAIEHVIFAIANGVVYAVNRIR